MAGEKHLDSGGPEADLAPEERAAFREAVGDTPLKTFGLTWQAALGKFEILPFN